MCRAVQNESQYANMQKSCNLNRIYYIQWISALKTCTQNGDIQQCSWRLKVVDNGNGNGYIYVKQKNVGLQAAL